MPSTLLTLPLAEEHADATIFAVKISIPVNRDCPGRSKGACMICPFCPVTYGYMGNFVNHIRKCWEKFSDSDISALISESDRLFQGLVDKSTSDTLSMSQNILHRNITQLPGNIFLTPVSKPYYRNQIKALWTVQFPTSLGNSTCKPSLLYISSPRNHRFENNPFG